MLRNRIPSLNWLRVFEAAAETSSFVGAANRLNMSPQAVSQQIRALEQHLDCDLFERSRRGVTLTHAGATFLPVVRRSLEAMEVSATSLFRKDFTEPLRLKMPGVFAQSWLSYRLSDFQDQHPEIEIQLLTGPIVADYWDDSLDLAVTFGSLVPASFDHDTLFGESLDIVAHPEIARTIATPADLLKYRLIEVSAHRFGWSDVFEKAPGIATVDARFCYVNSTELALTLASQKFGLALARSPATDAAVIRSGLEVCLPEMRVMGSQNYALIYPSRKGLPPSARKFRYWVLGQLELANEPIG